MEANKNQWLKDLGFDDSGWPDQHKNCMPSAVCFEYDYLRTLAKDGNMYGVLLQIRDIFETLMKIPCIMGIIILDHDHADCADGFHEVMSYALQKPMAMGDWYTLAGKLIKKSYGFPLPKSLSDLLKRTRKLYETPIEPDGRDIVYWRNDTIGHGALRFEDDAVYEKEVRSILLSLKKYFSDSRISCYENLYIQSGKAKMTGEQMKLDSDPDAVLYAEGKIYPVSEYIISHDEFCFFFDSYYLNKKKARYSSFIGGEELLQSRQYFIDLLEKLEKAKLEGHHFGQIITTREEENLLELLSQPSGYVIPEMMLDKLLDKMDELQKGTILIQMERGTGKSAFANQMSGLHHKNPLIRDSFSRIYHLSNASLRGINDFAQSLNFSFTHSNNPAEDIYASSIEICEIDMDAEDPAEQMASFLNQEHRIHQKEYTILVLDGIDELSENTKHILDFIPHVDQLDTGVFVILLSRLTNENTVLDQNIRMIETAESKADFLIRIERRNEMNVDTMRRYIEKTGKTDISADELIQKADYRFLYLKPYILIQNKTELDTSDESNFFEAYMNYLFSLYGNIHRTQLKEIVTAIALFPSITLDEYREYLNCPELTYSFIGILNDLMPLMSVTRHPEGNQYQLANTAYTDYVLDYYFETAYGIIKYFIKSFYEHDARNSPKDKQIRYFSGTYSNEDLYFFGRNLISLIYQDMQEESLLTADMIVDFLRQIYIKTIYSYGYEDILLQQISDFALSILLNHLNNEIIGIEPDLFSLRLLICFQKILNDSPFDRFQFRDCLTFSHLKELYLTNLKQIPEPQLYLFLFNSYSITDEVILAFEQADCLEILGRYVLLHDCIPNNKDFLKQIHFEDEETEAKRLALFAERKPAEKESADLREDIDQLIEILKDPNAHFGLWYRGPSLEITIDQCTANTDPEIKEAFHRLCEAYYQRLCSKVGTSSLTDTYHALSESILWNWIPSSFHSILCELFPESDQLPMMVSWADKLDDDRDAVSLLVYVIRQYQKQNNIRCGTAVAEKLAYEYELRNFCGEDFYGQLCDSLQDHYFYIMPLVFPTANTMALWQLYTDHHMEEKASKLLQKLLISIAIIEEFAEHCSDFQWDEEQYNTLEIEYFRLSRRINGPDSFTSPGRLIKRQLKKVTELIRKSDRRSTYGEMRERIDIYLQYQFCLSDPEEAQKKRAELIQLIRSMESGKDPETVQVLEYIISDFENQNPEFYLNLGRKRQKDHYSFE